MSTQWAGAKIADDSGGAVPTQTPVATGQSDSGLFSQAHHAVSLSGLICKSKHSHVAIIEERLLSLSYEINIYILTSWDGHVKTVQAFISVQDDSVFRVIR